MHSDASRPARRARMDALLHGLAGWLQVGSLQVGSLQAGPLLAVLSLAALLLSSTPGVVAAQEASPWTPDTLEAEVSALGATQGTLPFWLHANRYGRVDAASAGALGRVWARRTLALGRASLTLGVEAVGRVSENETAHLTEAFVRGRYAFLQLHAGRVHDRVGTTASALSSGSLARSANATPFPEVVLSTTGYTRVPFTRGFVDVRARYGHAWMTGDRFVRDAYLHHKTLYLRVGGSLPVRAYAGLVHNVMWGGTSSDPEIGRLPQGLDDYVRTVFALSGSVDAPKQDRVFVQGNHLGIWDFGVEVTLDAHRFRLYRHTPYEDNDNLHLKSIEDGLQGIAWSDRRASRWLDRVAYEFLYTKWQSGPVAPGFQRGGPGGQDNYYNNGLYRSGWTGFGRTVGAPLLTPREDGPGVANNRVVGHHLGLAGHAGPVDYRALATYTRNAGTYADRERAADAGRDYRFEPPREQVSVLLETRWTWPTQPRLTMVAAAAVDAGTLYDDGVGARLGLVYRPTL